MLRSNRRSRTNNNGSNTNNLKRSEISFSAIKGETGNRTNGETADNISNVELSTSIKQQLDENNLVNNNDHLIAVLSDLDLDDLQP